MHRGSLRLVLPAVALLWALPLTGRAAGLPCRPITTATAVAVAALADRINGNALLETSRGVLPWPVATSPFVTWYARFIVATGAKKPPTAEDQDTAATLVHELSSVPGADLGASVWSNSLGTTYRDADAARLRDALCVRSTRTAWRMGQSAEAPVELLMRKWIIERARQLSPSAFDSAAFVSDLSSMATGGTARSNHAFNVLTALFLHVRFQDAANVSPAWNTALYYDDAGVRGIRLRSSSARLSLYLFSGKSDALGAFALSFYQDRTDKTPEPEKYAGDRWKSVLKEFKPVELGLAPLDLLFQGRRRFSPALNWRDWPQAAYGTTISKSYNPFTGLDQSTLLLRGTELFLGTVAGIEGTDAPLYMTADEFSHEDRPTFAFPSEVSYFVVDDRTGIILARGTRIPQ
jgi:hypothetical protein